MTVNSQAQTGIGMRKGSSRLGRVAIKREAKADPDTSGPSSRRRSDVNVNTPRSSAAGPSATTSRAEPREYGLQEMREKVAGYVNERELTRMREGPLGHAAAQINAQELDEKIADVVRYMLAMQHKQPDVPVPRTKLNELCAMEGGGKTAKLTSCVLQGAQACLAEVFGMHMQELERGASKLYVLRSLLPATLAAEHLGGDALDKRKGFTAAVLALIHLNGGKATDEELEAWLKPLGVDRPAAGGPPVVPELAAPLEEVLKDLERQHYLAAQPCDAAAPQGGRVAYTLGLAAQDRLPEADMKQLISRVFGDGPRSLAARNAAAAAGRA